MKLSEFILLDEVEKQSALLHNGVLIAKRKSNNSMFFLFQLTTFYVEASFDAENKGIQNFEGSSHYSIVNPYLESISVDELLR